MLFIDTYNVDQKPMLENFTDLLMLTNPREC